MAKDFDTSIAKVSQIHTLTAEFVKKRLAQSGFDDFVSSHGYILYQLSQNQGITMKELAAKLSEGTPQLRVDFYEVDGKVYFGEMYYG